MAKHSGVFAHLWSFLLKIFLVEQQNIDSEPNFIVGHYQAQEPIRRRPGERPELTVSRYNLMYPSVRTSVPSSINRRKTNSQSHSNNWSTDFNGEGVDPDSKWGRLRVKVFQRDNYSCSLCGSTTNLTVDHIREISLGGNNSLSNLRTLCKECHEKRHHRNIFDKSFSSKPNYGSKPRKSPLASLIDAAESGQGIGISYVDREGLASERVIRPTRIYKYKEIYINAYCELDKGDRVFRLDRLKILDTRRNIYHNATNSYTGTPWQGDKIFNSKNGKTIYP